ncbi:MAG: GvpL/GvpF family gas vesicle protein [Bacteroidota bacterium]
MSTLPDPMAAPAVDTAGQYVYCFIRSSEPVTFSSTGIGELKGTVRAIPYRDIAVVVSESPVMIYPSRRRNMMPHTRVLEEVMATHTILPARFSTVVPPEDDLGEDIIAPRYEQLDGLLHEMDGKVELGLRVMWHDGLVFQEIVEEQDAIRALRDQLVGRSPEETHYDRMRLGEMIEAAIEGKRAAEAAALLDRLRPFAADVRENDVLGDRMVLNTAFLVDQAQVPAFDAALEAIDAEQSHRMSFTYVGPVPPYNFVSIVL